jgi:hypothetical protein
MAAKVKPVQPTEMLSLRISGAFSKTATGI